jgi:hypothetical protein
MGRRPERFGAYVCGGTHPIHTPDRAQRVDQKARRENRCSRVFMASSSHVSPLYWAIRAFVETFFAYNRSDPPATPPEMPTALTRFSVPLLLKGLACEWRERRQLSSPSTWFGFPFQSVGVGSSLSPRSLASSGYPSSRRSRQPDTAAVTPGAVRAHALEAELTSPRLHWPPASTRSQ